MAKLILMLEKMFQTLKVSKFAVDGKETFSVH